jgi:hypothetical protein
MALIVGCMRRWFPGSSQRVAWLGWLAGALLALAAVTGAGLGGLAFAQTVGVPPVRGPGAMPVPAATVLSSTGETVLLREGALLSPARPGTTLTSGDRVTTRADGRIELRFSDGAVVALQPNTEFRIDSYRFDMAEQKNFMTLVRGALRTVSGAIGKRNRDDYRMTTPSATIGIRGTEYEANETVCPPRGCESGSRPGLLLRVIQGRVAVSNEAGSVEVPTGGAVQVADRRTAPAPPPRGLPPNAFTSTVTQPIAAGASASSGASAASAGQAPGAPVATPPAAATSGAAAPAPVAPASGSPAPTPLAPAAPIAPALPVAPVVPLTPIEPILPLGPAPVPGAPASGEPLNPRPGISPGQRSSVGNWPMPALFLAAGAAPLDAWASAGTISPRLPPY